MSEDSTVIKFIVLPYLVFVLLQCQQREQEGEPGAPALQDQAAGEVRQSYHHTGSPMQIVNYDRPTNQPNDQGTFVVHREVTIYFTSKLDATIKRRHIRYETISC